MKTLTKTGKIFFGLVGIIGIICLALFVLALDMTENRETELHNQCLDKCHMDFANEVMIEENGMVRTGIIYGEYDYENDLCKCWNSYGVHKEYSI